MDIDQTGHVSHPLFVGHSLRNLAEITDFSRKRASSYDKTGGNADMVIIRPGERRRIFDHEGPGCITHIWTTQMCLGAKNWPRHVIIRIWWDDEVDPSVECPLGDFFGLGHGEQITFTAGPVQMSPKHGKGFNCWWPMPFKTRARIEIENDNQSSYTPLPNNPFKKNPGLIFYYYVDFETYDKWPTDGDRRLGYFHAQFNRVDYRQDLVNDPDTGKKYSWAEWQMLGGKNTRANGGYGRNHLILRAKGNGHYVGCNINIDNSPFPFRRRLYNWPGEGDDMIFIDDDIGKEPTLYGTGTEDYINQAFCPQEKYDSPTHGIIKGGGFNWAGKISYYRYHLYDPIRFRKGIEVTIEHGHNNHRGDDWATTAYWYQTEPHSPFPPFPDRVERMPRANRKWVSLLPAVGQYVLKAIVYYGLFYLGFLGLHWLNLI